METVLSRSERQRTRSRFAHRWLALGATGVVAVVGAAVLGELYPAWRLIHYPLHAAVESVGAFAAFIVAALILGLRRYGHLGRDYIWVASALVGMGFLDGLHAILHAGKLFVWLHSTATLIGGLVFMFVWLAERVGDTPWVRRVPAVVLGLSVVLGLWSVAFPETIPNMVTEDGFTVPARVANILGGVGFLIAAAYFVLRPAPAGDENNRTIFSTHCFLFGISGVIFEFSVIWDAAWWFWHVLRVLAYMAAIAFYFTMTRRVEVELRQLKDNLEGTVRERTATLQDEVDRRQHAETLLRKVGQAVDQSPVMIFITDLSGVIEYINPRFEEMTGYSQEEALGRTPRLIKSDWTSADTYEDLWETILNGHEWRGEIVDRAKDGREFWANASISPIRDNRGEITHFVAMHEDITHRKDAERAMLQAKQASDLANKAKTELMANMSHELRTPLNAIIGFSSAMNSEMFGPLDGQYKEYAAFINSSGEHLLDLINDILDVSAVEAGKLVLHESEVRLTDVFDAAQRLVEPKAAEGKVMISGLKDAALPVIVADERRMKQILLNLLSNAVKFTPPGGDVVCTAARTENGGLTITVADNGIGMSEEDLEKAVTKFGQVDSSLARKHEGTGLGLPLTIGLVEAHGGRLEMESAPGEGTTARIYLPLERVVTDAGTA